jgi:dihydroorotate dehydrogenase
MFRFLYKNLIKPILFCFQADSVHDFFLKIGYFFSRSGFFLFFLDKIFNYKNNKLKQNVLGINFEKPIGLAAGFDYNADLVGVTECLSFGFHTIGTVTNDSYQGNPKPMLDRLPKSKALVVNKGFKNDGIDYVLRKVKKNKSNIPLGLSIGATNKKYVHTDEMIDDVYSSFVKALKYNDFDYFELNISCPNLINIKNIKDKFDEPMGLGLLLNRLSYLKFSKPVFVKMPLCKDLREIIILCEKIADYKFVSGVIIANLATDMDNFPFHDEDKNKTVIGKFSGKPTEEQSNYLIGEIYKRYKNRFTIIGCGGVFDAEGAYEKIKRGASLVQMITGMIYEGPSQIGNINKGLVKLLKKDGYKSIEEAIGSHYK